MRLPIPMSGLSAIEDGHTGMKTITHLSQEELRSSFGDVFDRLFLPVGPREASFEPRFRDKEWPVIVAMALQDLEPEERCALMVAARAMGDERVVLTDAEVEPRHQRAVAFTWADADLLTAYGEGPYAVDAALFGPSGTWAVYFVWEPRLAYLAGTPAFMEVFLREVGGIEVLKRHLRTMVDETEDPAELYSMSRVLEQVDWAEELMGAKYPHSVVDQTVYPTQPRP